MGTEGGGHLPEVTHPADDYPGFTTLSFAEGWGGGALQGSVSR